MFVSTSTIWMRDRCFGSPRPTSAKRQSVTLETTARVVRAVRGAPRDLVVNPADSKLPRLPRLVSDFRRLLFSATIGLGLSFWSQIRFAIARVAVTAGGLVVSGRRCGLRDCFYLAARSTIFLVFRCHRRRR